ncbi:hypothetical protein T265_08241 [Opisthorchis viverrini]|uniref:Uncharacterized protein n=1 Tax=Opisthorchis viverrini TaxID=6198 RepID=A0A074ZEB5_OPIVI|nr:hypothetical protein T265_08241 [Opisthorchis viverrini]KER23997.1 hypothetical protein T265_08241 [Opisthorchis viverrini]
MSSRPGGLAKVEMPGRPCLHRCTRVAASGFEPRIFREHEGWDNARLPRPKERKSRGEGRVRTTDLPVSRFAPYKKVNTWC